MLVYRSLGNIIELTLIYVYLCKRGKEIDSSCIIAEHGLMEEVWQEILFVQVQLSLWVFSSYVESCLLVLMSNSSQIVNINLQYITFIPCS